MEQLSGLDAAFVHQDSRRTPMHISAVLVYDIGKDQENAISLAALRKLARERLADFPLFNRKLRRVPMGMDTPYWVDAPDADWNRHIDEGDLTEGSDWYDLHRYLADLHGRAMNLDQPLWEMHLLHGLRDLEGLPPNCQALVISTLRWSIPILAKWMMRMTS